MARKHGFSACDVHSARSYLIAVVGALDAIDRAAWGGNARGRSQV